jgi:hypothetical protein
LGRLCPARARGSSSHRPLSERRPISPGYCAAASGLARDESLAQPSRLRAKQARLDPRAVGFQTALNGHQAARARRNGSSARSLRAQGTSEAAGFRASPRRTLVKFRFKRSVNTSSRRHIKECRAGLLTLARHSPIWWCVGPQRSRPALARRIARALLFARSSGRRLVAECPLLLQVRSDGGLEKFSQYSRDTTWVHRFKDGAIQHVFRKLLRRSRTLLRTPLVRGLRLAAVEFLDGSFSPM